MDIKDLVLDSNALDKMGLKDQAIYIIEYDIPTPNVSGNKLRIPKNISEERKREIEKTHKKVVKYQNKLLFMLKFKLHATRHLDSCWLIEENRLELAIKSLEELKEEMKVDGFKDIDKRLRIIPILTTIDGFETFEEKKAEFLLQFSMEHIKYTDKAKREQKMAQSTLWRCKEAYSIIEALKEELKSHVRYNEIIDTNQLLGEQIAYIENMLETKKKLKKQKNNKKS